MKNNAKRWIALCTILAIITSSIISIYAAEIDAQIITSLSHERILNIESDYNYQGLKCGAVQGMVIGRSHDCLFVAKINKAETACILYYFPNFNDSSVSVSNQHAIISITNAGHVNGMAIDDNNIYFNGKTSGSGNTLKTDYIIRIPRALIVSKANQLWSGQITQAVISEKTATQNGYTKLIPKVANPNAAQQPTVPYVNYNRVISNMTCIDINGVKRNDYFIINYQLPGSNFYNETLNRTAFTRAKIMEYNGEEFLYISESTSKVFFVKNTLGGTNYTNADICYSSDCGFFVPKFYDEVNSLGTRTKNVILWADIDGIAEESITYGSKTYPSFVPDKINLNPKTHQESLNGVTKPKYLFFEIEGMDFDDDLNLYFSANVKYVGENNNNDVIDNNESTDNSNFSDEIDLERTVSAIGHDGIFKLTRTDTGENGEPLDWTLENKPS